MTTRIVVAVVKSPSFPNSRRVPLVLQELFTLRSMCSILQTIVCLFVLSLSAIALSVLRFMATTSLSSSFVV